MTTTAPIHIFYRDDMVPADAPGNYSKSPTKPRRFLEFLRTTPLWPHVALNDAFAPLSRDDVLLAHAPRYVDAFWTGERPLCVSNGLAWTPEFRDSVLLTNACLLAALTSGVDNPGQVTMAPVSGFHHAQPGSGSGYCTFSGQVIAALKLYRERGLRGAWIDLDGHFGNSIEDSHAFAPDLADAIVMNLNPTGTHRAYLNDLTAKLDALQQLADDGKVGYVAFAHGADSHEWDQLGSQCSTDEWLEAARLVYTRIALLRRWNPKLGVTLALFGGYRDDHPESVLGLHAMDLAACLQHLFGVELGYRAEVRLGTVQSRRG